MPRAMRITPITAAPITTAVRPLRAIQFLNRLTLSWVRSGREHVAEQRQLEQDLLHQAEPDDEQDGRDGPRVEVVDVIERVEVGDAGEAQNDPDDEGDTRIAFAQQAHRQRLGRLARLPLGFQLGLLLPVSALFERTVAPGAQDPRDRHQRGGRRRCPPPG